MAELRTAIFAAWMSAATVFAALPVRAESWIVEKAASRLGFIASQANAEFTGRFHSFTAEIEFSPTTWSTV